MNGPWTCACCGTEFDELPLDVGVGRGPAAYLDLSDEERPLATLSPDFCVIRWPDRTDHFVRVVIEVPVPELQDTFCWGVWVGVSEEGYARAQALFALAEVPAGEPAVAGRLASRIVGYTPSTLNMGTILTFRGGGQRPSVVLAPTDHALVTEQREGIPVSRVKEIVAPLLHR